jgi:carboxypeptidase C (cathepsin A)
MFKSLSITRLKPKSRQGHRLHARYWALMFRQLSLWAVVLAAALYCAPAYAEDPSASPAPSAVPAPAGDDTVTHHTIVLGGKPLSYTARAGTILLRDAKEQPTASIFYVAYTLDDGGSRRPLTFFYNGGPGSSSMWLHMGSFAPVRVRVADGTLTGPPPYTLGPNDETLLDATDMVFIDMPDTGFGRISASPKTFFGLDADVAAFQQFIERYISIFGRWNSPKFLYGESYGTTRSAALANALEQEGISINGVVLQSTILNFGLDDLSGADEESFALYLPTEAAAAWYHHALPGSWPSLPALVAEVEQFASGSYSDALAEGDVLPRSQFDAVAAKLHDYTGLPIDYIKSSNLRVPYWRFESVLLRNSGDMVGRFDARYQTKMLDRYQDFPAWDPLDAGIDGAYTTAINQYLRGDLQYKTPLLYKYGTDTGDWDFKHNGISQPNVMPDLAEAMTYNPSLKIFSANGYFDFATPFYETMYSLQHLGIAPSLQQNITFGFYPSGHMIYVNQESLAKLHDDLERWYAATLGGR